MARRFTPKGATTRPPKSGPPDGPFQINRGSWQSYGLRQWVAFPGDRNQADVVYDRVIGSKATVLNAGWELTPFGHGLRFNGTNTSYALFPWHTYQRPWTNCTVWVRYMPVADTTDWATLYSIPYRTSGWTSPWSSVSVTRSVSTANVQFALVRQTGTRIVGSTTGNLGWVNGKMQTAALTWDLNTLRGYVAGETGTMFSAAQSGTNVGYGANTQIILGMHGTYSAGEPFNGYIYDLRVYHRTLSAKELRALHVRSWDLYEPLPSTRFFSIPDAGVAAQNITCTGIGSSESIGTTTLTVGAVTVTCSAIAGAETFGATVITTGAVTITCSGIVTAEALGSPSVAAGYWPFTETFTGTDRTSWPTLKWTKATS